MVNKCICPSWQVTSSVSSAEELNYQVGSSFVNVRWKKNHYHYKKKKKNISAELSGYSVTMQILLSKRSNSPGGSRGPRLAIKKYDQTTVLLTQSAMAAGTANWVRNFPFCCEVQIKQSRLVFSLTQRYTSNTNEI